MENEIKLAELVLLELPRAQEAASGRSLVVVERLMNRLGSAGAGGRNIESARVDTFLAIAKIGALLLNDGVCPDEHWAEAIRCTRVWRALLI